MATDGRESLDAVALASALAAAGFDCEVQPSGTLAILVPARGMAPPIGGQRLELGRLARRHGFTHVALEIDPAAAGLPDEPAAPGGARADASVPRR